MMDLDLGTMSLDDLEALKKAVSDELAKRKISNELVVYTHDCYNTSNYHREKYKHWAKRVYAIDTTKTNGYAFQGDFLAVNAQHKLPIGSIIVEMCNTDTIAYRLCADKKQQIAKAKKNAMASLIDAVAVEMKV